MGAGGVVEVACHRNTLYVLKEQHTFHIRCMSVGTAAAPTCLNPTCLVVEADRDGASERARHRAIALTI